MSVNEKKVGLTCGEESSNGAIVVSGEVRCSSWMATGVE